MGDPVLVGYGSHGRDIETAWERAHGRSLWVFDDFREGCQRYDGSDPAYLGVLDPRARRSMQERHGAPLPPPLVDPDSSVHRSALGGGAVVMAGARLLGATLGVHVHVGCNAVVMRAELDDYVTVCPGAVVCGDTTVGAGALVGAGAVVADRVQVGDGCRIGAGAVVPPCSRVPPGTTVTGVWRPHCRADVRS